MLLYFVPDEEKTNAQYGRDLCDLAVGREGRTLQYVQREMRDEALCKCAVGNSPFALQYVPEEMRDKTLCLAAVANHADAIAYIPKRFKDAANECSRALWAATLAKSGYWLKDTPAAPVTEELCSLAVASYGKALAHVPAKYQTKGLIFTGVTQDSAALKFVDRCLLSGEDYSELCRIAVYGEQ